MTEGGRKYEKKYKRWIPAFAGMAKWNGMGLPRRYAPRNDRKE